VNLQPEDLAAKLYVIYLNKESWSGKRTNARTSWELNFNAKNNYRSFAKELVELSKAKV
jgi:hypothetical protein